MTDIFENKGGAASLPVLSVDPRPNNTIDLIKCMAANRKEKTHTKKKKQVENFSPKWTDSIYAIFDISIGDQLTTAGYVT